MLQPNDNGHGGHPGQRFGKLEFVRVDPATTPARDHSFDARGRMACAGNDDDCATWLHERLTACTND